MKQERYTAENGRDWIDECSETLTEEEFRGAMKFTIGKYLRRLGKKDAIEKEVGKIQDYATRWLEYEKSLEPAFNSLDDISVKSEPVKSEYPKLMISKQGRVVAFIEESKGVLISGPDNVGNAGGCSDEWVMDGFKDYQPEVEFPRIVEYNGLVVCATEGNGKTFNGYVLKDNGLGHKYQVGDFDTEFIYSLFGL